MPPGNQSRAWMIIRIRVVSKYQHTAHVNSKLVFRGKGGLLTFSLIFDVATIVDLMSHGSAVRRTSISSQLPLADCLPCWICIGYSSSKLCTIHGIVITWLFFSSFYTLVLLYGRDDATKPRRQLQDLLEALFWRSFRKRR
jgi:hypothetical protein